MHTIFYLAGQRNNYWNGFDNYIILWHTITPNEKLTPNKNNIESQQLVTRLMLHEFNVFLDTIPKNYAS